MKTTTITIRLWQSRSAAELEELRTQIAAIDQRHKELWSSIAELWKVSRAYSTERRNLVASRRRMKRVVAVVTFRFDGQSEPQVEVPEGYHFSPEKRQLLIARAWKQVANDPTAKPPISP